MGENSTKHTMHTLTWLFNNYVSIVSTEHLNNHQTPFLTPFHTNSYHMDANKKIKLSSHPKTPVPCVKGPN